MNDFERDRKRAEKILRELAREHIDEMLESVNDILNKEYALEYYRNQISRIVNEYRRDGDLN